MKIPQASPALLQADDLVIGYPGQVLCGSLQLAVQPGSGLGIIGANGSGKSTLLRTVLGELAPVQGCVQFNSLPLNPDALLFRRDVAVQVTDGAFFEELSVAEHLELAARGHRVADWQQAVGREIECFDLAPVAGKLPAELSSGQRRKLLLAAALVRPARLLILDEPEQRLDLRIRQRLYERLAALRAEGTGILVVSHDPLLLRSCLSQTLLLDGDEGQLLEAGQGAQWLER